MVKLRYCEKATKYEKFSNLFWRFLSKVKTSTQEIFSNIFAFSENLNFNWANLWPHPRPLQEYLLQMSSSPSQYSKLLQFWKQCFCWGLDLYEQNTHSLGFRVDYWFIRIKTSQIMFVVQLFLIFFSFFFIIFSFVYVVLNMRAVAICLRTCDYFLPN